MKFLGRLLLMLSVLAIGALAVLRLLFPPARIQLMIEKEAGQKMNRQIKMEGIHLGFSGLTIDHLKLSEVPTFAAGTFLVARDARLHWSLQTLAKSLHWGSYVPSTLDGKFTIGDATTPYYDAQHLSVEWHLTDFDPTLAHLNGSAQLRQGTALIKNLSKLGTEEKSLSVVLLPLQLLQSIDRLGIVQLGLPNLEHWPLNSISGDYRFVQGVMKIDRFVVDSAELGMSATGDIALVSHRLNVAVAMHSPKRSLVGQLDLKANLSGTLEHPTADLDSLRKQAFKATVTGLLNNPKARKDLQNQIQKIFH